MNFKFFLSLLLLTLFSLKFTFSQPVLTGSEIDSWNITKTVIPPTYTRASSYIYMINNEDLLSLLKGVNYSKEDLKALGIKKKDKPDYLYMSISIDHPQVSTEESISIPLMLYDFRKKNDTKSKQAYQNFNGKYLDNIKDEDLNNSIYGEITVKALVSNASVRFWKNMAGIAADLGKSATTLLTGNPVDLTSQLTGILGTGMDKLKDIDNGDKEQISSFFVTLVDYQFSSNYNEVVTAARLYQIHWSYQDAAKTSYFDFDNSTLDVAVKPKSFSDKISDKNNPLILVIETRSEYTVDLGTPEFTDDYEKRIENEWTEVKDEIKREMAKNYSIIFVTANRVNSKVSEFNKLLQGGNFDPITLLRIIDDYYSFKTSVNDEYLEYDANSNYDESYKNLFQSDYTVRYDEINRQLENIFDGNGTALYLNNVQALISSLLVYEKTDVSKLQINQLYNEINVLSFYRDLISDLRTKSISIGSFTSNDSYSQTIKILSEYENELYSLLTKNLPTANGEKKQRYNSIIKDFPKCQKCVSQAGVEIATIDQLNLQNAIDSYKLIKESDWTDFRSCKDALLFQFNSETLETKISENNTYSDDTKDRFRFERRNFLANYNKYENNIANKTDKASIDDVILWTNNVKDAKQNIIKIARMFAQDRLIVVPNSCPFTIDPDN